MNLVVTIMAAGEGKRMNSPLPKVLHMFNGKPMLVRIIETAQKLNPTKVIVVTGQHDLLIRGTLSTYLDTNCLIFVNQVEPKGTGDAIKQCLSHYSPGENVLILNGDMPLITQDILERFVRLGKGAKNIRILVARFSNPTGYGRIFSNSSGVVEIVEEKDCSAEQKLNDIVNTGIYVINSMLLKMYIPLITNNNAQQEYYLTDIVKIIRNSGGIIIDAYLINESENKYVSGVNTQDELAVLENA